MLLPDTQPRAPSTQEGANRPSQQFTMFVYAGLTERAYRELFVPGFERETGVTVTLDPGWWDLAAKLKVAPAGQASFDLVMTDPTQGFPGIRDGLFTKIRLDHAPNARRFAPKVLDSWIYRDGWGVPYVSSAMTIAWNREVLPNGPKTWGDLFSEGLKGEIMLYNAWYMSLYTFAAAKASLDGKPGTARQLIERDLDSVLNFAREKRDWVKFWWPATADAGFYQPGTLTFEHYAVIFGDPYFRQVALTTLRLGVIVTGAALVIAYPLAVYLTRGRPALRTGTLVAVLLPKLTNLLVAMYGMLVLLANAGPINGFLLWLGIVREPVPMFANLFAVVFGETLIITPYPVLIIASALQSVDPALEAAARGLGASPPRAFYEVSFKLTLPSVLLAALVTLIWALGAFTAPVVLGNPELYTVAVDIFTQTFEDINWPLGAAITVVYTVCVLLLVVLTSVLQRKAEQGLGR